MRHMEINSIDDLINFIKEELREAREVYEDFIRAESYEYVLEKLEELKTNQLPYKRLIKS